MKVFKRARRSLATFIVKRPGHVALVTFLATLFLSAGLFYVMPLRSSAPPAMHDVTPTEAYEMMSRDPHKFIFVDVRLHNAYDAEHAIGAINLPIHDLYDDRLALPKKGQTIVLICGDGKLAGVAYGYLQDYGFTNLERIEGGLSAWKKAGLPTVLPAS